MEKISKIKLTDKETKKYRRLYLNILSVKVLVLCGSETFLKRIARIYSFFKSDRFEKPDLTLAVVLNKECLMGTLPFRCSFVFKGKKRLAAAFDPEWCIPAVDYTIAVEIAKRRGGFHQVHAASLVYNGKTIMLLGESDFGKSTLTAALAKDKFRVLTDETVFLEPKTFKVSPFPKSIYIAKDSRDLLLSHVNTRIHRYDLHFDWLKKGNKSNSYIHLSMENMPSKEKPYDIDRLFFLTPNFNKRPSIAPMRKVPALKRFFPQLVWFAGDRKNEFNGIVDWIGKRRCYDLHVGDLKRTVSLIKKKIS